jgi:O-antigen ligase
MLKKVQSNQLVLITILFIIINSVLIVNEFFLFGLGTLFLAIVFLAFFSIKKLLLLIVFCTPLSFSLESLDFGGIGMFVPTEPMLFGVLLLFFLKLVSGQRIDMKIINYPITIAILFYITWGFITTITSEMPVISFKFLLSRLWFIIPFYFLGIPLLIQKRNIRSLLWIYLIPLSVVILITTYKHSLFYFDLESSHLVMYPFFKDHTRYGAVIAMMLPMAIYLYSSRKKRLIIIGLIIILVLGLVLSYTRAAWVSLLGASIFGIILKFRLSFYRFISLVFFSAVLLFLSWNTLVMSLEKNTQDSSTSLKKHVESVSNISTDASNLERINRWNSAIRMFREKPLFGWGPGTYAFQYAPFQRSSEKTIISTNQGDLGNAHSEFLGPLAESGFIGMLSFLFLMITVYYCGMNLYYKLEDGDLRNLVFYSLLSLTTYFVHGLLNNFLDTDKLAIIFWSLISVIAVIDIYYKEDTI